MAGDSANLIEGSIRSGRTKEEKHNERDYGLREILSL